MIGGESLQLDLEHVDAGGSAGKRSCPFSFVVSVAGPPISAGELTRTVAPGRTPPCASLTVPMSVPVTPCAAAVRSQHHYTGCGREHQEIRPRTHWRAASDRCYSRGSAFAWPEGDSEGSRLTGRSCGTISSQGSVRSRRRQRLPAGILRSSTRSAPQNLEVTVMPIGNWE